MQMMSNSHSLWSGSDSSTDEQRKTDGGWWKNTKDAFKRPWKWKAAKKKPPSYTPTGLQEQWGRDRPFGAFPPFMAQLGPGVFQQERRNSNPDEKLLRSSKGQQGKEGKFDLPEYEGQRRPRLDSVFPMRDPPPVAVGGAKKPVAPPGPRFNAVAVGRSSSFNETDRDRRERSRRETDGEEGRGQVGSGHSRGDSVDSTSSGERSLDRRKRRMGAVRQLPKLPLRRNIGCDWTEVHSLPEVGHRRRRRPTPAPFERGVYDALEYHYGRPVSPPMHNFAHPQWDSPADGLPTLTEESDSGDIKGFDDFKLY